MNDRVEANKTQFPGGPAFRTDIDPVDGAHVQVNKIQLGVSDEFDGYVGWTNPLPVTLPAAASDAFGRQRVSNPETLFDSKQIFDKQPLFWDEAETGAGTSATHSADAARTRMAVSATTAGSVTRQTFMRFNYQPGKSQLIIMTGLINGGGSGITAGMGYYDDDNGIFVQTEDGTLNIVRRTSTSGSAVDNQIPQSSWNVDPLDGTGPSGITLDPTKTQIFFMDIEWLGVGRVRCGFVVDGQFHVAHQFLNTNVLTEVYMSTANLPLRYEIENDGTGGAAYVDHICSTVISEGGTQDLGVLRYKSTEGTHVDLATADQLYPVIGLRLKSASLGATVKIESVSVHNGTADNFEWVVAINPTLSATPTFSNETNSAVQYAIADGSQTVTSVGTAVTGGFIKSSSNAGDVRANIDNAIRIGSSISGTPDQIWLCVRPMAANADIDAGIGWRELQ